jgi:hypothetical protein
MAVPGAVDKNLAAVLSRTLPEGACAPLPVFLGHLELTQLQQPLKHRLRRNSRQTQAKHDIAVFQLIRFVKPLATADPCLIGRFKLLPDSI